MAGVFVKITNNILKKIALKRVFFNLYFALLFIHPTFAPFIEHQTVMIVYNATHISGNSSNEKRIH